MTLRSDFIRARPDFPVLTEGDVPGISRFVASRGWLSAGERVLACDAAGEGNMNLTLRVETNRRAFILKQARPWVEKYDQIAAPLCRGHFERLFYQRVRTIPGVGDRMPELLHADANACVLVLEDVRDDVRIGESDDRADLTSIYRQHQIDARELTAVASYLRSLHDATQFAAPCADLPTNSATARELENREMRALNHEHIFLVPLAADNGLPLDEFAAGLSEAARVLRVDVDYRSRLRETAERYLLHVDEFGESVCLLHGDYFPGSWLRSAKGLRIIDPEFAFAGDPEFDVGCAAAHFALAGLPADSLQSFLTHYGAGNGFRLDPSLLARYAAAEVMRRLIGVAQLPLPPDERGFRSALLLRSREAMLVGAVEALFA